LAENNDYTDKESKNIVITLSQSVTLFDIALFQKNNIGNDVKPVYTLGSEGFSLTSYGVNLNIYNFSLSLSKTIKQFPNYFEPEKVDPEVTLAELIFSDKEWAIKTHLVSYKGFYLTQPELTDFYINEKKRENLNYKDIGISLEFNLKLLISQISGKEIKNYFNFLNYYNYSYGSGFDYKQIKDIPVSKALDVIGIIGGFSISHVELNDDMLLTVTSHNLSDGIKKPSIYYSEKYLGFIFPFATEEETLFGNLGFTPGIRINFGNVETGTQKESIFGITTKYHIFMTYGYNISGSITIKLKGEYERIKLPLQNSNYFTPETFKLSLLITIAF